MDVLQHLSAEVQRIVTAPYAASLQKLLRILRGTPPYEIQRWASGRCDISLLCVAVLRNLHDGSGAMEVVQRLSCISSFRDAVLEHEPLLLDTLLGRASSSDQGYNQYATVCTALLSSTPLFVSIPAQLSTFLESVLARAVTAPSADTIRPVYLILSGVGCAELRSLSQPLVIGLQEQLKKILCHNVKVDDHHAKMLCLALLAKLTSREVSIPVSKQVLSPTTDVSRISETCQGDQSGPTRGYFGPQKASKTLDITVVTARYAVSQSRSETCAITMGTIIEILNLCTEVARSVSGTDKRTWIMTRGSMSKAPLNGLLKSEVDPKARLAAVELTLALYDHSPFPIELHGMVNKLFQEPAHVSMSRELTRAYLEGIDEPCLASTMLHMIHLTGPEGIPNGQTLLDLDLATAQAIELANMSAASQDFRRKILYLLSTSEFLSPLRTFATCEPLSGFSDSGYEHHMHGVCPARYLASRQELQQKFSVLLLQTALHASMEETLLEPWLAKALLEKQTRLASKRTACKLAKAIDNVQRPSLFESGSTPEEIPATHAWRDRLKKNLLRDAGYQQESVIKIINEVYRDLEARCDDAERPYREEQARSQSLQLKLNALEDQLSHQQDQNENYVRTINELETQKFQCEGRANTAEKQLQDSSIEIAGLRKAISDTKSEASQTKSAMAEAARQQDLFYMATMTSKDGELERRDVKVKELEARAIDLAEELAHSVALERKGVEDNEKFKFDLAQQYDKLNSAMALSTEKQGQIEGLLESNSSLAADKVSLLSKVEEFVQRSSSLESNLEAQAAAFKAEKLNLQAAHEGFKTVKEAEMADLLRNNQQYVNQIQEDFKRETDEASRQNHDRTANLKKKIQRLHQDLKVKTKELAKEQEMKKLILKFAGKGGQDSPPTVPSSLDPDRPPRSSIASPISSRSLESTGSSQRGSTPKRPRFTSPWNSNTPLLVSRKFSSNPSKAVIQESAGKPMRQGLSELGSASTNKRPSAQPKGDKIGRRHTSIAVPAASRKLEDNGDTCLDNQSFTDSDIFTSTTRERIDVRYDDTTVDI